MFKLELHSYNKNINTIDNDFVTFNIQNRKQKIQKTELIKYKPKY